MNKMIMNRLTMLAVTLMASIACFAQGKYATSIPSGKQVGEDFDYKELKYKVLGNQSGCYLTEVIGFCDAVLANPDLMDTGGEHNEFIAKTVEIVHYVPGSSTSPAMSVQSVATDAFKTVDSELAGKVNTLIIDYDDSEESLDKSESVVLPTTGSTFAGLTALTEVQSFTPSAKVAAIPESSFAKVVYQTATLIVPESTNYATVKAYAKTDGWSKFYKKSDGAIILGDVTGEGSINVFDVNRIKKMIAHTMDVNTVADFDGSGAVNVFDVNRLKKVIAKTY